MARYHRQQRLPGERREAPQHPNQQEGDDRYFQNEQPSTRYTMYGTSIPYAVTEPLSSVQQAHSATLVQPVIASDINHYDYPDTNALHQYQSSQQGRENVETFTNCEWPQTPHRQIQPPIQGGQPTDGVEYQDSFFVHLSPEPSAPDSSLQDISYGDTASMEQVPSRGGEQLAEGCEDNIQPNTNESDTQDTNDRYNIESIDMGDATSEYSFDLEDFGMGTNVTGAEDLMSYPIESASANSQPWSSYTPSDYRLQQRQQGVNFLTDYIEDPTTTRSTYTNETPQSVSVFETTPGMSTMSSASQGLGESVLTQRPHQELSVNPKIELSLANLGLNHDMLPPQTNGFLGPPSWNNEHDCAVSTTASTPSAPDTILCQCGSEFSGRFRAGNFARHKRHKHNGPVVVDCPDSNCNKVFKRQDSCLKHVRKYHPRLASGAVPRPERRKSSKANVQEQHDQNYELTNVGSFV